MKSRWRLRWGVLWSRTGLRNWRRGGRGVLLLFFQGYTASPLPLRHDLPILTPQKATAPPSPPPPCPLLYPKIPPHHHPLLPVKSTTNNHPPRPILPRLLDLPRPPLLIRPRTRRRHPAQPRHNRIRQLALQPHQHRAMGAEPRRWRGWACSSRERMLVAERLGVWDWRHWFLRRLLWVLAVCSRLFIRSAGCRTAISRLFCGIIGIVPLRCVDLARLAGRCMTYRIENYQGCWSYKPAKINPCPLAKGKSWRGFVSQWGWRWRGWWGL